MPAEAASRTILSDDLPVDDVPESQNAIGSTAIGSPDKSVNSLARLAANSRIGANVDAKCLLPEALRRGDGVGPVVALNDFCTKLLVVTLDITDVVERTGLTVSIWGSPDQVEWGTKPLLTFRQRQYCGVYSVLLNLAARHDVRYLRVHWSMSRWGRTDRIPVFGFEMFAEESGARVSGSVLV
jgi:hypothetical protein